MDKSVKKVKKTEENKLVIGEVVENFIKEEPVELSQEEEIEQFRIKKENERKIYNLNDEERKKKENEEQEEEEKLRKQKAELLTSLRERIPAIEKRIYGGKEQSSKKANIKMNDEKVQKVKKVNEKDNKGEISQENIKEKNKGFERE